MEVALKSFDMHDQKVAVQSRRELDEVGEPMIAFEKASRNDDLDVEVFGKCVYYDVHRRSETVRLTDAPGICGFVSNGCTAWRYA